MDRVANLPLKIPTPWATGAKATFVQQVPTSSQIGITNGAASFFDGFVPLNFTPVSAGGIPPFGKDMNGVLNQITQWDRWVQAGGPIRLDPLFQSQINGYPAEARVGSNVTPYLVWQSTANNNTSNPDTFGGGWQTPVFPDISSTSRGAGLPGLTVYAATPASQTSLGAHIAMAGNTIMSDGKTNVLGPKKWIRLYNGNFSIINDAYTAEIFTLDNTGNLSNIHNLTAGGAVTAGSLVSHGDAVITTDLQAATLHVSGTANTGGLTVSGNAQVSGTLSSTTATISGTTTTGTLAVTGGATMGSGHVTGTLQVDGTATIGALTRGQVEIVSDAANPGHIRFYTPGGTYAGYIGNADSTGNYLQIVAQNGWSGWQFLAQVEIGTVGSAAYGLNSHGSISTDNELLVGKNTVLSGDLVVNLAGNVTFNNNLTVHKALAVSGASATNGITNNGDLVNDQGAIYGNCHGTSGTAASKFATDFTTGALVEFQYPTGASNNPVGNISTDGHGVIYGTLSDELFKIQRDGPDDVMALLRRLMPKWFSWKDDPQARPTLGFFAGELGEVIPEAVRPRNGNPGDADFTPATYDPGRLVPLLTAALLVMDGRLRAFEARA